MTTTDSIKLDYKEQQLANDMSIKIMELKKSITDNNVLYSTIIETLPAVVNHLSKDRQVIVLMDSITKSIDIQEILPSAITMCINLTNPIKKDNELTLELKEILDNNDITRYDIWISLVRSGIQIVECYEGISGYNKKLQLKESLLQIIEDLESKDKDKVMNYYNTTLDATISAIIDAWKAKSPNKKSCFICF
tara:strand:- start:1161 stop:1739 length:579 start_codon:yes stop_codon:yes gene_type:complete